MHGVQPGADSCVALHSVDAREIWAAVTHPALRCLGSAARSPSATPMIVKDITKAESQPQWEAAELNQAADSGTVPGNQCVLIRRVASSAVKRPVASAPISF